MAEPDVDAASAAAAPAPVAEAAGASAPTTLVHFAPARIRRALAGRRRYKYVKPRVVSEGGGWKIVSANCSRNVDPAGGEIPIAWLVPDRDGTWQLFACDHGRGSWQLKGAALSLGEAMAQICADPLRVFWP